MCRFDELEHDTLANRIVRATLVSLARSPLIDRELGREMSGIARMFRDVRPHRIAAMDFSRVILHRNNRHYAFVLQIYELLHATLMPDETGAGRQFRDFTRDRAQMASLFERFVFNFYVHHSEEIADCGVRRATIPWDGGGTDESSKAVLPQMRTDICLMRNGQPLVIDCKFYGDAFQYLHGTKKLNSANLYQLFSYVQNATALEGWSAVEGMLLYPETGEAFEYEFRLGNVRIRAVSVNLHAPWRDIHRRLIELVAVTGKFVERNRAHCGA
jgi:5-methylcytosine-specific restriction enzyme subunit McrC